MRYSLMALCVTGLLLLASGCAGRVETSPPAPPPVAPATPTAEFSTKPTSGGSVDVTGTVTGVNAESTAGGGVRLTVRFSGGIPVWAVHSSSRGQMLWLEMSAPAPEPQGAQQLGTYGYGLYSSATASWLTVFDRGIQEYRVAERDSSLVLEVHPAGKDPDGGGMKAPEGANDLVKQFVEAQARGADLTPYLSAAAQAQYAKLPPFRPTEFTIARQSGQVPDTLLYQVRLSNQEAFTDQFLFVTAGDGGPQVSLILGHQPVARPTGPDGKAALSAAVSYLDAWSRRDANGMYAALATPAQQSLTAEQRASLGGLSNPHPFRYEIHAIEKSGEGCYRFQVLQSMEYTGEGELGRGIGPLYVTQSDGRYGVLLEGTCGG